jgi:hypothetical protein
MKRREAIKVLGLGAVAPLMLKERFAAQNQSASSAATTGRVDFPADVQEFMKKLYPAERPPRPSPPPAETHFTVQNRKKQVIRGIGFEIQSDGIRSGNKGLDEEEVGIPHDLVPGERARLYKEMLTGFRYCRLAGGLYLRGTDAAQMYLQSRWSEQFAELRETFHEARLEGASFEYWSPLPYWKANRRYVGTATHPMEHDPENVLRCYGPGFASDPDYKGDTGRFLNDFAKACRQDLITLRNAGIPISYWNLQNEPFVNSLYSSCTYTSETYAQTFEAVAPQIRKLDSKIAIIADTSLSWDFPYIRSVLDNPSKAPLVDALVIHLIGVNSSFIRPKAERSGKPRFNNEFEYLQGPATAARCLNTVQVIMNWFQLADAPAWFWLHALKPYQNAEASGYSLGFWRPLNEADPKRDIAYPDLKPGHWKWNPYNWHAVGSFVRRLPWNSVSIDVFESDSSDDDLRIMAFTRPNGKLTVVVSNRSYVPHTFRIDTARSGRTFRGYRYTPDNAGTDCQGAYIGAQEGPQIAPLVPDLAWEFWEEQ